MSQFRYQLRIVLDSGYIHITETYTDPFNSDALRKAKSLVSGKGGSVEIRNDQGEWVVIRTPKIASVKVRDMDQPPPPAEKRFTKPGSFDTHHGR